MTLPRPLTLELLEARLTPVTFGNPWPAARHLTLSFAPDGTRIAGHESNLFQALDRFHARPAWQREVLRAFQTWAIHANSNVSVTADGGQRFGIPGRVQGDARFGDIRVGGQRMAHDALSVSVPYDPALAGTWTGDVFLNSNHPFRQDLFPAMLHEAGHVFGLDHSDDPASPMYPRLTGQTELTAADIVGLWALYGTRVPDAFEGNSGNNTFATASNIRYPQVRGGYDGSTPVVLFGDLTTAWDVDVYALRPFANYRGPVTFRLQTAGRSALVPRLTIYNAAGQMLGEATADSPFGSVLTVRLEQLLPNTVYYARVQGATGDIFDVGSYGLGVTFDGRVRVGPHALDRILRSPYETLSPETLDSLFLHPTQTLFNDDLHGNDAFSHATQLLSAPGYAPDTHFELLASLSDAADVDFYRLRAPAVGSGPPRLLTVMLSTLGGSAISRVAVYDTSRALVPAEVLANGNGTYTVQLRSAASAANYYLRIAAAPGAADPAGNYALLAYFHRQGAVLDTFAAGALDDALPEQRYALYNARSQLFQFVLSAEGVGAPAGAAVRMSVVDSKGVEVFRLTAAAGETVSGPSLFLAPGAYRVRFTVESPHPGALPALTYRLRGARLSDPIGPVLDDPTLLPMYSTPSDPSLYRYPGDIFWTLPYLWVLL